MLFDDWLIIRCYRLWQKFTKGHKFRLPMHREKSRKCHKLSYFPYFSFACCLKHPVHSLLFSQLFGDSRLKLYIYYTNNDIKMVQIPEATVNGGRGCNTASVSKQVKLNLKSWSKLPRNSLLVWKCKFLQVCRFRNI